MTAARPVSLLSHIDLDGYACNVLLKHCYGSALVSQRNVDYGGLVPALEEMLKTDRDRQVYVTDLAITPEAAQLLVQFPHLLVIDHHEQSKGLEETPIEHIVSMDHCAAYLLAQHLKEEFRITGTAADYYESWGMLVNDYDMWIKDVPESEQLNSLLYISNRDRFVDDGSRLEPMEMILNNYDRIQAYIARRNEYVQAVPIYTTVDEHGTVLGWAFAERYQSYIGEAALAQGAQVACIIDLHGMKASLRSQEFDVSAMAAQYGGGGHKEAAGYQINLPQDLLDRLVLAYGGYLRQVKLENLKEEASY